MQLDNISAADLKDREWWRGQAKDLYFFQTVLCADAWSDKFNNFGELQRDMCDFLSSPSEEKLLSVFRLSYKTTVLLGLFAYWMCWGLADGITDEIVYMTATKDNAANFRDDLKHTLLESKLMHYVFPELPRDENEYAVMTKNRIQHKRVKLDFASAEQTLVSRHYNKYVNDDLENDKNIKTKYMRQELINGWRYQKAILTKIKKLNLGLEIEVGTPYHYEALMWFLMESKHYDKLIVPYRNRKTKVLAFPEVYCQEDFDKKREKMGETLFASQFELRPIAEADALCREEWFRFYTKLPQYRWRTLVIDPGGDNPQTNDPTGITVIDWDQAANLYVVYANEMWLTSSELMEKINEWRETFQPDDMRIEKDKFAVTVADIYKHRFPGMHISFVEHKKQKKELRIWRLRQYYNDGRVFHAKEGMEKLTKQLLRYQGEGTIEHDDILDSFAYQLNLARPPMMKDAHRLPSGKIFEPAIEKTFDEEFGQYMEAIEARESEEGRINDNIF